MILKNVIYGYYSVDMHIGDIDIDPCPISIFVSYSEYKDNESCYLQFETECNNISTLLSMDIYDSGLVKEISLITYHVSNCININENYNNLHIKKGMPSFCTRFISKGAKEEDDECQFFSDEFIGYMLKNHKLIVLFTTKKPYLLVKASSQLSFIFDKNYKMISIDISFSNDEFREIEKWFGNKNNLS